MNRKSPDIQNIEFHNPRLNRLGIDLISVSELRHRSSSVLIPPQRVEFHILLMVESGHSQHQVDFRELQLQPGTLLYVKPGQVQQWTLDPSLEGQMLLIRPESLDPSLTRLGKDMGLIHLDDWPELFQPSPEIFKSAIIQLIYLRDDIKTFDGSEHQIAMIGHSLVSLMLRLSQTKFDQEKYGHRQFYVYRLFTKALEQHFHKRLSVLDYANMLGYSQSTLSRACIEISNLTAKEAISSRIVLEAKRLLIHSNISVINIAHQLGFTEPTNFVKFFKKWEGLTPMEYRNNILGTAD